jgi:hypothetical protein
MAVTLFNNPLPQWSQSRAKKISWSPSSLSTRTQPSRERVGNVCPDQKNLNHTGALDGTVTHLWMPRRNQVLSLGINRGIIVTIVARYLYISLFRKFFYSVAFHILRTKTRGHDSRADRKLLHSGLSDACAWGLSQFVVEKFKLPLWHIIDPPAALKLDIYRSTKNVVP